MRYSQFLAALRKHRLPAWIGLILYACAVTFPHQNVQDVAGQIATKITHKRLYEISAGIALLLGLAVTWLFARKLSGQVARRSLYAFWILSFALMAGTWRLLMANNTELVHFPQYFPEGTALLAITLSPMESMAWVAIFGGLDEAFQYIFLMHGRPVSLDFNDIYMDLGGAAAGILFAMAWMRVEPRVHSLEWKRIVLRPGVLALAAILTAAIALLISGKLVIYDTAGTSNHWFAVSRLKTTSFWYFNPVIFGPHHFHELAPLEGVVLILATIAVYSLLDRKLKIISNPVEPR